jgi:PAS domain S-box-containing protein
MSFKEKILIVDDEQRIRDSLKDLLSIKGYEIKTCRDGHEALACLSENTFDLVLLDLAMEIMDGFQVMESMARRHLDIPVIIMTGNASTSSAVQALRRGAYDYLRKPFEPEELFKSVTNALTQKMLKKDNQRVKKELQDSEMKYRALAEHSLQGIAVLRGNPPVFIYTNPRWVEMFGYSADEALSLSPEEIWNLVHPDDRAMVRQRNRDRLMGKPVVPIYEFRIIRKDGVTRWVEVFANKMGEGEEPSSQAVYVDITERKMAETALRISEERFRNLLESISSVAVQGYGPDGVIQYWNQASVRLYGYSAREAIGQNLLDLIIPPEMRAEVTQAIAQMAETGQPMPASELSLMRKDGSRIAVFSSHAIVRIPERPSELFCVDIDLTELKQAEEEHLKLELRLQQAQKAESLSRMAGAIAHHFNNQLAVVIGNLELALADWERSNTPLEYLTEAMGAANRAAEVSSSMLTYLGQTTAAREPMDICEVCRRSLPLLETILPKRIFLATCFTAPGPIISGSASQIQQILANLVTNAAEAAGDGLGAIELSVRTVLASEIRGAASFPIDWQPRENAYACLEVVDAGCGIDDKDIAKLFDPFYTSKFTGRGLGLSVVLGIARAHRGAITVESKPGKGTIFRIYLPVLAEGVSSPLENSPHAPEVKGGGTVLLVEDEEQVRHMAVIMLTRMGFTVLEAPDGNEAVAVFRRHQEEIRWVLCDMTMPGMNGWETLAALRGLSPHLPVILASGYDEGRVMAGTHSDRPDAFLHKPFSMKDLAAAIGRVLVHADHSGK